MAFDEADCCSLAMTGSKGPCGHSMAPPPAGVGRRMERKRQKYPCGSG